MKDKSSNKKQHIIYSSVLLVVVIFLVFLGKYNLDVIRQDYTSKIDSLSDDLGKVSSDLHGVEDDLNRGLAEDQNQIDVLAAKASDTDQKIEDASKEYQSGIQKLQETTKQYELQIGELNQQVNDLAVESESFSGVISDVIDSVVSVITNVGQGSGAIISSDGLVVTNYHVIDGVRRASVMTYDGNTYSISLVGYSEMNDLAVLMINYNKTFSFFDFGDSDNLKVGQKVVALGNPAGLSFTATEGIVSSPSRLAKDGLDYIQTDVTLNPGNSGGPLINSKGELVGIVNFKVSGYESLGFAIPSNRVDEVIGEIID